MNKYVKIGCVLSIVRVTTVTMIWFYLLYQILIRVEATELMMFLFWVYVPLNLALSVFTEIITTFLKDDQEKSGKNIFGSKV